MKFLYLAAITAIIPAWPAFAATPDAAVGLWATETRHGVVEVTRCGESICGKVVDSEGLRANPDLRDIHNKNESLRNRRVKGMQMLGGFHWDGKSWSGGTIYNPEDGGTYKATVTSAGQNQLKLRGCIVWPLCKTQVWTRSTREHAH